MEPQVTGTSDIEKKIDHLLEQMTLDEKIGQCCLVDCSGDHATAAFRKSLTDGRVGAILNLVDRSAVVELQRLAINESRLGIPLLVGRDVIHGFRTIFPIPLGQAASWNPSLVEQAARLAGEEAAAAGINWTYAPMLDIARDPRWGRVAESFGEDPYLTSVLGTASIRGFQGNDLASPQSVATCAKHFVGYGASESGRDYNSTNIPINELRNVHLPPFKAAIEAGVASIMTSFSDVDGIPATANEFLLREILRDEYNFDGMVVSDWGSVPQLMVHGLTANDRESALLAAAAGTDMEMSGNTFAVHLKSLVEDGSLAMTRLDEMVGYILRLKFRLGLFEQSWTDQPTTVSIPEGDRLEIARQAARESLVLLTNKDNVLPLQKDRLRSIAVLGPLAHNGYEQLGTWVFDGDTKLSETPLEAIQSYVGDDVEVDYLDVLETSRSRDAEHFPEAVELAERSDVVLLFVGEEAILSGEAHCRTDIGLPGIQERLVEALSATGTPVVLVLMTGRPLALQSVVNHVDALLCAWHAGSMAGPAIVDILFGEEAPSGKLPATFPRVIGQIPIYYAHKNTGRPPTPESVVYIDDIEVGASQHSFGNTSFHLDIEHTPLFPFGHGLSYTEFRYSNIRVSSERVRLGERFTISAELTNTGDTEAIEVAQLYIRDLVGSLTRPVRELKRFDRCRLKPGEAVRLAFELHTDDLAFYNRQQQLTTEPGEFHAWIGGSSEADLKIAFTVTTE